MEPASVKLICSKNSTHQARRNPIVSVCERPECKFSLCCLDCALGEHSGHKMTTLKQLEEFITTKVYENNSEQDGSHDISQEIDQAKQRITENIEKTRVTLNQSIDQAQTALNKLFDEVKFHHKIGDFVLLDQLTAMHRTDRESKLQQIVEGMLSLKRYCDTFSKPLSQQISQQISQLEWTFRDVRSRWLEPFSFLNETQIKALNQSNKLVNKAHQKIDAQGSRLSMRMPMAGGQSGRPNQKFYLSVLKFSLIDAQPEEFRFRLHEGCALVGLCEISVLEHGLMELTREHLNMTNVSGVYGVYTSGPQSTDLEPNSYTLQQRSLQKGEQLRVKYAPSRNNVQFWFGRIPMGRHEIIPRQGSPIYVCVALTAGTTIDFICEGQQSGPAARVESSISSPPPARRPYY